MPDADVPPGPRLPASVTRALAAIGPAQAPPRLRDCARGAAGGLFGLTITGLLGLLAVGDTGDLPWIVAPMGATAVLVFAVPGSPLAQPFSAIGGNVVSALVGLAAAWAFDVTWMAVAFGVGGAIGAMVLLRCLHPPGGACALTAAMAPSAVTGHGVLFAFWPVGFNSVTIVAAAIAFHALVGGRYPHVPRAPAPAPERPVDAAAVRAVGDQDVAEAMARLDRGLDVAPADVVALMRDAEAHVLDRRLGGLRCGDVMGRDVATVTPGDSLYRVRLLINQRRVKALPVLDDDRRVLGIVAIVDLFNHDAGDLAPVTGVMTRDVATVHEDTPVAALIEIMVEQGHRHVPVLDDDDRLVGLVSRADLIGVLHRLLLETPGR